MAAAANPGVTLTPGETSTCLPWCTNHEYVGNICFSLDVDIHVDGAPHMVRTLSAGLALDHDQDGAPVVLFAVNGVGPEEITLAAAKAFAQLLTGLVEQAEAGTAASIPAPRIGTEGGAL